MIKTKSTTLNLRIPLAQKRAAQKIARERGTTLSALVRQFVFGMSRTPNATTEKAVSDFKSGRDRGTAYQSVDDMFADILK